LRDWTDSAIAPLKRAIRSRVLASGAKTDVIVVRYGDVATVAYRGDLEGLTPEKLGGPSNDVMMATAVGIARALDELSKTTTPRRAMIVFGDGLSWEREAFADFARRTKTMNVATYAILWRPPLLAPLLRDEPELVTDLVTEPPMRVEPDRIPATLATIIARLDTAYELTFDYALDGENHTLELRGRRSSETVLELPKPSRWWAWAFLVGGAALGLVGVRLRGRRRRCIARP
jgi:hypothetical protein